MTVLDKNTRLLSLVARRTEEGELIWEETENEREYQTTATTYSMRIRPRQASSMIGIAQAVIASSLTNPYAYDKFVLEVYNSDGVKTNEIDSTSNSSNQYSTAGSFIDVDSLIRSGLVTQNLRNADDTINLLLVHIYTLVERQVAQQSTDIDKLIEELE